MASAMDMDAVRSTRVHWEDEESAQELFSTESDGELALGAGDRRPKLAGRIAAVGAGMLALFACAFLVAAPLSSGSSSSSSSSSSRVVDQPAGLPTGHMTARMLLESDDLADAVADNVVDLSHGKVAPSERALVRQHAREKLSGVSRAWALQDPEGSRALDQVTLDSQQQAAMLRMLRSLSDPRMQRIGLAVAHSVRDGESMDQASLEHTVAQSLRAHKLEVRELLDAIHPEAMGKMYGSEGRHLEMDADKIQLLKNVGDGWDMKISASFPNAAQTRRLADSTTPTPLYSADRAFSILRMIFDQCRVVIDIIRPAARLFGHDLHANPWLTSAFGMADGIFAGVSCELDGAAHDMDTMEMASCPLRVASAASDALRWVMAKYHLIHYPSKEAEANAESSAASTSTNDGDDYFSDFFDDDN